MDTQIINAIARLERAGSENSRATKKLNSAAITVADLIERTVPVGVVLPRGYRVRKIKSNVGTALYLVRHAGTDKEAEQQFGVKIPFEDWIDGTGGYLHGDFNCEIPAQSRRGSLQFAQDVSEGLLDEIAEFLEQRAQESEQRALLLEQAI